MYANFLKYVFLRKLINWEREGNFKVSVVAGLIEDLLYRNPNAMVNTEYDEATFHFVKIFISN